MSKVTFSTSISLMFREHQLLDRFAAARDAGLFGVEIQTIDEGDPTSMAERARLAGVTVVLINVGMSDFGAGGPGLSGVPGRERAFRDAVARGLEAAQILDAAYLHLGPSRVPAGVAPEECLATYRGNIEAALELARGHRSVLLIEPLNTRDSPDVLLSSLDEAASLIHQIASPRLGLQFDIYHATMNGVDPREAFVQFLPLIRHIQFSDVPGRHEPGTGAVDFGRVFATIATSSYAGWVGAEYYPSKPTADTLGWITTLGRHFSS